MPQRQIKSPEVIDLLATTPSARPFYDRVRDLELSSELEQKVLGQEGKLPHPSQCPSQAAAYLTGENEKELATEVLLLRHRFTELVLQSRKFRQAALTIIQNIYLFQNRRIFFGTSSSTSSEVERREALQLFSSAQNKRSSIPLVKTFRHLVLARVWNRILSTSSAMELKKQQFTQLLAVVEKLNTIRNIYMILTTGLVKKLASRINDIYKESVTLEDALQIGSFGIARAAYRYHQSSGIRFSTFAAAWVFKEIQRQSLDGRLIRLSSHTVEQYSRAAKTDDPENLLKFSSRIQQATPAAGDIFETIEAAAGIKLSPHLCPLAESLENRELQTLLQQAIDQLLSAKCSDIIKRRFGFAPYQGKAQSVIDISKVYGVTRGSIYQIEQVSLKKLNRYLITQQIVCH